MPRVPDTFNESEKYVLTGGLLNEIARKLEDPRMLRTVGNMSKSSANNQMISNDNPLFNEGQVGIAELITNDPDEVRSSGGTQLDPGETFTEWRWANRWYVRFVIEKSNQEAHVAEFPAILETSLYSRSDRSASGLNEGDRGEAYPNYGQLPLFAPGDKIPCIYYPGPGVLIPLISPPEEITQYDFTTGSWAGQPISSGYSSAVNEDEIAVGIRFWDPDVETWFTYPERRAYMPKDAIDGGGSLTLSLRQTMLFKDGVKFQIVAGKGGVNEFVDPPRIESYSVESAHVQVKMLGRHWRTDPELFPFQGDGEIIYNYLETYENDDHREAWVGELLQVPGMDFEPHANTKRRFRDVPTIELHENLEEFIVRQWKPGAIRELWTAEVIVHVRISAPQANTYDRSSSSSTSSSSSSSSSYSTTSTSSESYSTGSSSSSSVSSSSVSSRSSSSTENDQCIYVVTDIHCNVDGTIDEVCYTRICFPSDVRIYPETCSPCVVDSSTSSSITSSSVSNSSTSSSTVRFTTSSTYSSSSSSSTSSSQTLSTSSSLENTTSSSSSVVGCCLAFDATTSPQDGADSSLTLSHSDSPWCAGDSITWTAQVENKTNEDTTADVKLQIESFGDPGNEAEYLITTHTAGHTARVLSGQTVYVEWDGETIPANTTETFTITVKLVTRGACIEQPAMQATAWGILLDTVYEYWECSQIPCPEEGPS